MKPAGALSLPLSANKTVPDIFMGGFLYATFTGSGLYQWNGSAWSRIDRSHTGKHGGIWFHAVMQPSQALASINGMAVPGVGLIESYRKTWWHRVPCCMQPSQALASINGMAVPGVGLIESYRKTWWHRVSMLYATFTGSGLYQWKWQCLESD